MERTVQTGGARQVYGLGFLRRDLVAGFTVAAVAVPQAMAYALMAGIPPEYGLYTAIVTAAVASLFSSSSHLIGGPTNAISLAVFSACLALQAGDRPLSPGDRLQAVFWLAILTGLIQILLAVLKLGDLTRYVSESVLLGFMAGAGVMIALGQLPNLLGLSQRESSYFLRGLWDTFLQEGPVNLYALGLGLGTIAVALGLDQLGKRWRIPFPGMLMGLLLASLMVWICGGEEMVPTIRTISRHLPQPHLPGLTLPLGQISSSALAIALLGLMESLAIAKSIAAKTRQPLDSNRQCLAEGLANVAGGLFQCLPGSGSLTRSAINYQAGAATRVSGLFAAGAVAATLLVFAPLAQYVPRAALSGILILTAWRLVDRPRLRYCLRATRFDAGLALATAAAAIFISIEFSILIGIFLSFLFFVPRAARLQATELTLSPERVIRERQPDDPQCTLMVLYSLEGELFFGAAPELDEHFAELARRVEAGARIIVLRLKRARNPDMVCLERLQHFLEEMHLRKVTVLLCGVRKDFAQVLENVHMHKVLPAECLFLEEATVGSSTLHAIRRTYELLKQERCPTCPRLQEMEPEKGGWYYMI